MRLWNWLRGWAITIDIWLHDRELYNDLRGEFRPDDYTEAGSP